MTIDLEKLFLDRKDLDTKSVRALLQAIKNNHKESTFDYIKFKQSVDALKQMEMDQITAYKSAFATAMTMGLTKDLLLKSAGSYEQVLVNEMESFAQALQKQIDEKVKGRRSEVNELQKKIEDHKRKIQQLEREISIFQNRIDTVDQDVDTAQSKIEQAKAKFLEVYNTLTDHIRKDIESIKNYIN